MSKIHLGIEFGSTRIKAVGIDSETLEPKLFGGYSWKSRFENGVWTYDLEEVWKGLSAVLKECGDLSGVCSVGISGMMHGYLAFDKDWNLLVPFRTWQNTITGNAARQLTELFEFNIPQRWSIAHLYEAVLKGEEHINKIAHITTLAGYIHYMLTGENVVGIGEASGIFPIDSEKLCYNEEMLSKLESRLQKYNLSWSVRDVLPKVKVAGDESGRLTEEGYKKTEGLLPKNVLFAAPEGDAGTGMVATNSISEKTGNVSAGTSIFAMVVLRGYLSKVYEEIDMVTTPDGKPVAMVHCNNCTNDTNAWVSVFKEVLELFDAKRDDGEIYTRLYEKTLEGENDCSGVLTCNYLAGEGITHLDKGLPMILRSAESKFNLANLFRSQLYSTMATLKMGMRILENEKVEIKRLTGHGGLFKTKGVGQKYMAAAVGADVTCMETSGEGGPYGMALLAAYTFDKCGKSLDEFLNTCVFKDVKSTTVSPDKSVSEGFNAYMEAYEKLIEVERKAVELF